LLAMLPPVLFILSTNPSPTDQPNPLFVRNSTYLYGGSSVG
jgi:hypothetical protein